MKLKVILSFDRVNELNLILNFIYPLQEINLKRIYLFN